MKKSMALVLALMMMVMALAACGGGTSSTPPASEPAAGSSTPASEPAVEPAGEKPKVILWTTGSQNLSDLFTAAIKEYNARPDAKCVMELQFLMSGTGDTFLYDRLAAAFKSNQTDAGFDIIAENSTALAQYVSAAGSEDLFAPLDFSMIPNYDNVLIKSVFDNTKVVPYRGTTVVFAYDSERVPEPPKTWDELTQWIKDNPGRFAYNVPSTGGAGSGFMGTAVYRFLPDEARISEDEKWIPDWEQGFEWMKEIHPYLYKSGGAVVYPNKNQGTLDLLINKEVDIIPAWADQVLSNKAEGVLPESVQIYQLDVPLSGTDVVFALPSIGSHAAEACDFINFMISPEMQQLCLESIYAVPVIDPAEIKSEAAAAVAGLDVSNFKVLSLGGLSLTLSDKWDNEIATLG